MAPATVVAGMFVLMNFLRIDRMDLVGWHPSGFITTDHVGAHIAQRHADQHVRYAAAIAAGHISQERVDHPAEIDLFGRLIAARRLGVGECSAVAVALNRGYGLAINEPRAVNRALRDAGLSVPGDLALVAFDDFEWSDLFSPRLTAVAQPEREMASTAVSLLLDRMADPESETRQIRLTPTLNHRDSCGCDDSSVPL